jgi:hypothetical protein
VTKKKSTRRSKVKNAALIKRYNSRIRQDEIDYDYLSDLSEEELKWLNDFTEEYVNASVGKQSEANKNKFHNTPELVKDCTDRNNARQRCIYSIAKARNRVIDHTEWFLETISRTNQEPHYDVEDELIDNIDLKYAILDDSEDT